MANQVGVNVIKIACACISVCVCVERERERIFVVRQSTKNNFLRVGGEKSRRG